MHRWVGEWVVQCMIKIVGGYVGVQRVLVSVCMVAPLVPTPTLALAPCLPHAHAQTHAHAHAPTHLVHHQLSPLKLKRELGDGLRRGLARGLGQAGEVGVCQRLLCAWGGCVWTRVVSGWARDVK